MDIQPLVRLSVNPARRLSSKMHAENRAPVRVLMNLGVNEGRYGVATVREASSRPIGTHVF